MACRLARATRLWGPVVPMAPSMLGFMASWEEMRACSSAALRAFSMASFMKVAAWEGGMDIAPIAGGPEELERSLEIGGGSSWVCGVGSGSIYTTEGRSRAWL